MTVRSSQLGSYTVASMENGVLDKRAQSIHGTTIGGWIDGQLSEHPRGGSRGDAQ